MNYFTKDNATTLYIKINTSYFYCGLPNLEIWDVTSITIEAWLAQLEVKFGAKIGFEY